jgi:hypothetical protein
MVYRTKGATDYRIKKATDYRARGVIGKKNPQEQQPSEVEELLAASLKVLSISTFTLQSLFMLNVSVSIFICC